MKFLACEGDWTSAAGGVPACTGTLVAVTREDLQSQTDSALSWDQVRELQGEVITLFALVFGFLVLKKVLK